MSRYEHYFCMLGHPVVILSITVFMGTRDVEEFRMTSKELVGLRTRLGLSQAELASLLGYWAEFYVSLEAGDLPITPAIERRVLRIAAQTLERSDQRPQE